MLSAFTSAVCGMPSTWNQFLMGFGVCFTFWFCMFAPAFDIDFNDKQSMTDEAIRERYAK